MTKIIIVGGVAGGMSAATRLRRLMDYGKRTLRFFCQLWLTLPCFR